MTAVGGAENRIKGLAASGNAFGDVNVTNAFLYLADSVLASAAGAAGFTAYSDARVYSQNHDLSGYDRHFAEGGQIDSMLSDFAGASGNMWRLLTNGSYRASNYPLWLKLGEVFCAAKIVTGVNATPTAGGSGYTNGDVLVINAGGYQATVTATVSGGVVTSLALTSGGWGYAVGAGKATAGGTGTGCTVEVTSVGNAQVTISAKMKKAHATQADGRLVVRGGQIAGVAADVKATLAANTSEQTLTITFVPTEAGVVEVEAWAEYVSGNSAVYVDGFTEISQAEAVPITNAYYSSPGGAGDYADASTTVAARVAFPGTGTAPVCTVLCWARNMADAFFCYLGAFDFAYPFVSMTAAGGALYGYLYDDLGGEVYLTNAANPADAAWGQFAVVCTGTTAQMFGNGVADQAAQAYPGGTFAASDFMNMLMDGYGGQVRNIMLIDRALTAGEVAALYAAGPTHDALAATGVWAGGQSIPVYWKTPAVGGVVPNSGDGGTCGLTLQGAVTSETD